jgi:DNA-directed RNA polymerase specialized sigma24 family protein
MVLSDNNKDTREVWFVHLYMNVFPDAARHVRKMGGSLDDAKDVFQEALVVYYEKFISGALQVQVNEKAYLIGIVKHLWTERYHEAVRLSTLDFSAESTASTESSKDYATDRVLKFLTVAGGKCMDLLKAFYYDKLNMEEIAHQFGYGSVRSSTVQKYKCLEKVREVVKEKSLTYESFID